MYAVVGPWVPPTERSRFMSSFQGNQKYSSTKLNGRLFNVTYSFFMRYSKTPKYSFFFFLIFSRNQCIAYFPSNHSPVRGEQPTVPRDPQSYLFGPEPIAGLVDFVFAVLLGSKRSLGVTWYSWQHTA